MDKIREFSGNWRWLSNFWHAPITLGPLTFPTNEHAYQAAKSSNPADWNQILVLNSGAAKRYGRLIQLRPDWDDIKIGVMREITEAKYDQHPDLKAKLLGTRGMELIEGNTWNDTFWGMSLHTGRGKNHLGRILMAYRDR